MTDVVPRPIVCLLPMLGVLAGFGLGIVFVLMLPNAWEFGFEAVWFPRWLGVVASLILWSMFTIYRGRSLHCGGFEPISSSDKFKYMVAGVCVFIGYTGMIFAFAYAAAEIFVLLVFLFLVIFLSEVGWGNPFYAFNALSRLRS